MSLRFLVHKTYYLSHITHYTIDWQTSQLIFILNWLTGKLANQLTNIIGQLANWLIGKSENW